jgi:hypothetical protein
MTSQQHITTSYWTATAAAATSAFASASSSAVVETTKTHEPGFKLTQEERMKKFDEHKFGLCVSCDSGLDDRADFAPDPRFPRGFSLMCNACVDYYNKAGYVGCGYGPFSNAAFQ